MLGVVVMFVTGIAVWKVMIVRAAIAEGAKFAPPPSAVTTVKAEPQTWQPTIEAVGTLNAVNGVVVSTDLPGIVSEIAFESGQPVKKGDLLIQLDSRQEEAQAAAIQARLDLGPSNRGATHSVTDSTKTSIVPPQASPTSQAISSVMP